MSRERGTAEPSPSPAVRRCPAGGPEPAPKWSSVAADASLGVVVMASEPTLPAEARSRLGQSTRTTDLSIDELALLESLGIEPLGLVLGSSIYHVGWQRARLFENQELTVLSQAMHTARSLALERMEAEARQLDADGVVATRLLIQRYTWGEGLAEFLAVGTAVRGGAKRLRPAHGRPFVSNLSGQDFWKLRRSGYLPVGIAFGCCVYHIAHLGLSKWMQQVGRNAEMEAFTQGTYSARELAMERMGAEARQVGGELVVGVALSEGSWGWDANVIEYAAIGTAVVRETDHPTLEPPALVVAVQGGPNGAGLGQLLPGVAGQSTAGAPGGAGVIRWG